MIVNALFDHYYSIKRKRGYEVIGWQWIILFLTTIIAMGIVGGFLITTGEWSLSIIFLLLFIILKIISRKTDIILEKAAVAGTPKAKELILKFLQTEFNFKKNIAFIELSNQLQLKADESKKTFNFTPQINMILPVFILLLSLTVQSSPNTLPDVIALAVLVLIVSLSINPAINTFSDIFLNSKYEKIMELAILVREIYLDELAKENYVNDKPHETVQIIKIEAFSQNYNN
ncbi:hypothetical protein [Planomicrobium sp. CPCC 101079]|uniref:hypothetical protein n=1 Tax=Planomicrobium sp. CPCC 101079 TaxID=2599618 RepID=UPI0011B81745|nr:hypothetical protein [Planomicrobium sp. CPCC 101079]TWT00136.1 hypothetical protein FQV28_18640 [Planomicrobium sp. CPCC 101079]